MESNRAMKKRIMFRSGIVALILSIVLTISEFYYYRSFDTLIGILFSIYLIYRAKAIPDDKSPKQ